MSECTGHVYKKIATDTFKCIYCGNVRKCDDVNKGWNQK